jgi:hypothetical protein
VGLPSSDSEFGQRLLDLQAELGRQWVFDTFTAGAAYIITARFDRFMPGHLVVMAEDSLSAIPTSSVKYESLRHGVYSYLSLPVTDNLKIHSSLLSASAETVNLPFFGQASAYFDLGVLWSPYQSMHFSQHAFSILMREDILNRKRSTDFSLSLGWTTKF